MLALCCTDPHEHSAPQAASNAASIERPAARSSVQAAKSKESSEQAAESSVQAARSREQGAESRAESKEERPEQRGRAESREQGAARAESKEQRAESRGQKEQRAEMIRDQAVETTLDRSKNSEESFKSSVGRVTGSVETAAVDLFNSKAWATAGT